MRKLRTLTLSLLLSTVSAGVWANPSMLGVSGNLLAPDTQVMSTGTLALSGSYVWIDWNGSTKSNQWLSLNYGLMPNLEVGLSSVDYRTVPAKDLLFQAKYRVLEEKGKMPAVAVGALDISNELGFRRATAYVVASRFLWAHKDSFTGDTVHPLNGFVGWGTGLYGDNFFGGLEWQLRKDAKLVLEYTKDRSLGSNEHLLNLGGQVNVGQHLTINAAAIDMKSASVGLGYTLDHLF